ncbi:MAG: hypothetical protein ACREI3_06110, partial [Nitrospirales bacterium]
MFRERGQNAYRWLPALILLIALVAASIGAVTLKYVESNLIARTGKSLAFAATDLADRLDRVLYERFSDTVMLAQASVFRGRDVAAMTRRLNRYQQASPIYVWLGVLDARGGVIAATDVTSVGREWSAQPWVEAVRTSQLPVLLDWKE